MERESYGNETKRKELQRAQQAIYLSGEECAGYYVPGAGVRVGACMLYGGIKIEAEQSIIVIVDEQNKLFIQHDIVIDNTESGIKNFLSSMQQGGIKTTDICFAISPGHSI